MEISTSRSNTVPKSLKQWMSQHLFFFCFFLAYVIAWLVCIPYVLAEWGYMQGNYTLFYILHVFGPAASLDIR